MALSAPADTNNLAALTRMATQSSVNSKTGDKNPFSRVLKRYSRLRGRLVGRLKRLNKTGQAAKRVADRLTIGRSEANAAEKLKREMAKLCKAAKANWPTDESDKLEGDLIMCLRETVEEYSTEHPSPDLMTTLRNLSDDTFPGLSQFARKLHDELIDALGNMPKSKESNEEGQDASNESTPQPVNTPTSTPPYPPFYPQQLQPQAPPNPKIAANKMAVDKLLKAVEALKSISLDSDKTNISEFIEKLLDALDAVAPKILDGLPIKTSEPWAQIEKLLSVCGKNPLLPAGVKSVLKQMQNLIKRSIKQIAMQSTHSKGQKAKFNNLLHILTGKKSNLKTFKEILAALNEYQSKITDTDILEELNSTVTELNALVTIEALVEVAKNKSEGDNELKQHPLYPIATKYRSSKAGAINDLKSPALQHPLKSRFQTALDALS